VKLLVSDPFGGQAWWTNSAARPPSWLRPENNRDSSSRPTSNPARCLEVCHSLGLVVSTGGWPALIREAQLEGQGPRPEA